MVYIIVKAWYPTHIGVEIGKKYLEVLKKYPPSKAPGKAIIPVAVSSNKNGIKVMSVTEVADDDAQTFADAYTWVSNSLVEYMNIEGFEYKIRVWGSLQASMEGIGLKLPE